MADHAGHAHSRVRGATGAVVVAILPVWISHDGAARDRVPGDTLWLKRMRAGDGHDRVDLIGVRDRPLERLHAAERASGDGAQPGYPQLAQERKIGRAHV